MRIFSDNSGQSAALIATMMIPITMALILVYDAGLLFQARRWTQSVADLSALSGGQQMDTVRFDADNHVKLNLGSEQALATCQKHNDLNAGLAPSVSCMVTEDTSARTVTVRASTTVNTFLLQVFLGGGNTSITVTSTAEAEFKFGIVDEMDH